MRTIQLKIKKIMGLEEAREEASEVREAVVEAMEEEIVDVVVEDVVTREVVTTTKRQEPQRNSAIEIRKTNSYAFTST